MPYESFLNRANAFRELNQLPVPLAEGITVNDLTMNKGVWHNRLERAKKKMYVFFVVMSPVFFMNSGHLRQILGSGVWPLICKTLHC